MSYTTNIFSHHLEGFKFKIKTLIEYMSGEGQLSGSSVQFSSVTQSCPTLCNLMNCSIPGLPVHHQLPKFTQTHVHHPSSRWSHPAISSSVVPFSPCPQSLPASGSFPMSQHFAWCGQSTGVSALASVLPKNTQDWSPLEWTRGRSQDGGGVGQGEHFLPHKVIKRAFKRRVNSTKQLLNAGRGHQAPRKAIQLFERR